MHNPDKLRVAKVAEQLADLVYRFSASFPSEERYGLSSQMRRAAVSVGSNIYEGCGRQSARGLAAFLYIANGSAGELIFQTRLAVRLGYGDARLAEGILRKLVLIRRMLSRLIRAHEQRTATVIPM